MESATALFLQRLTFSTQSKKVKSFAGGIDLSDDFKMTTHLLPYRRKNFT
jgi:hypothetical protein